MSTRNRHISLKYYRSQVMKQCLKPAQYQGEFIHCQLHTGHKGRHQANTPDGRTWSWDYGRHQTCHMREEVCQSKSNQ